VQGTAPVLHIAGTHRIIGPRAWGGPVGPNPIAIEDVALAHNVVIDLNKWDVDLSDGVTLESGIVTAKVTGTVRDALDKRQLDVTVVVSRLALDKVRSLAPAFTNALPPQLGMANSAALTAHVTGTPSALSVDTLTIDATDAALGYGEMFVKPAGLTTKVAFSGDFGEIIHIRSANVLLGSAIDLSASGEITGDFKTLRSMNVTSKDIQLKQLAALVPMLDAYKPDGIVSLGKLTASGPLSLPKFDATVGLDGVTVQYMSQGGQKPLAVGATGRIVADPDRISFDGLTVALADGKFKLNGSAEGYSAWPKAKANLVAKGDRLNVEAIFAALPPDTEPLFKIVPLAPSPGPAVPAPGPAPAPSDPLQYVRGVSASLDAHADKVIYSNLDIQDANLKGELKGTVFTVTDFSVKPQSGTLVAVPGTATVDIAGAEPLIKATLRGRDIAVDKRLASYLQVDLPLLALPVGEIRGSVNLDAVVTTSGMDKRRMLFTLDATGQVASTTNMTVMLDWLSQIPQVQKFVGQDFAKVVCKFAIKNLTFNGDLVLERQNQQLRIVGTTNIVTTDIDYRPAILIRGQVPEQWAAYVGEDGSIPFRLTGTLKAPKFELVVTDLAKNRIRDLLKKRGIDPGAVDLLDMFRGGPKPDSKPGPQQPNPPNLLDLLRPPKTPAPAPQTDPNRKPAPGEADTRPQEQQDPLIDLLKLFEKKK
jgi:hypothetical protein